MLDINRLATAVIMVVVVIIGGIVCITDPATLDFESYVRDVAIGVGALGIAHGIDSKSTP